MGKPDQLGCLGFFNGLQLTLDTASLIWPNTCDTSKYWDRVNIKWNKILTNCCITVENTNIMCMYGINMYTLIYEVWTINTNFFMFAFSVQWRFVKETQVIPISRVVSKNTRSFVNSQGYEYFTPSLKNVHLLSAIKWWDNDAFENQQSGVAKKTWALPHCDPVLSFFRCWHEMQQSTPHTPNSRVPLTIESWILGMLILWMWAFMEWHTQLWLHLVQTQCLVFSFTAGVSTTHPQTLHKTYTFHWHHFLHKIEKQKTHPCWKTRTIQLWGVSKAQIKTPGKLTF